MTTTHGFRIDVAGEPGTTSATGATALASIPAEVPDEVRVAAVRLASWWPRYGWRCGAPDGPIASLPALAHAELAPLGFDRWDAGEERLVFLHPSGWCLKVPRERSGMRAQAVEINRLAALGPADRRRFAETYALPGSVLLQRVYRVGEGAFDEFADVTIVREIHREAIRLHVRDVAPCNIGWTADGQWVFVDWAGAPPLSAYMVDFD